MRRILLLILCLFSYGISYGQWNSQGLTEADCDGHNLGGGGLNDNTVLINLTLNGSILNLADAPDYAFFVIGYAEDRKGNIYYETFGDIEISDIVSGVATFIATPVSTASEWGMWSTLAFNLYLEDLALSGDAKGFEVVLVQRSTGFYASTGFLSMDTQEITVNIENGATSLLITVPPLAALCSGSTTGNTTTATISGATGTPVITLADAGKGGATFNPLYATVVGDKITILPTCPAGVYTVKATVADDVATAETEFTFTVNQTPTVTLAADNTTVCHDEGAKLTATVLPSGGSYTYKWEEKSATALTYSSLAGTGATQTLSNLLSTKDYRVIAVNGNCTDTVDAPVRITVNPAPSFNIVPNNMTICQGEQVSLTATKTGGVNTGVTFAWNQGQSSTGPWTAISGQTSSNLKVTPAVVGDIHYQVVGTLAGCSGKKEQKVTVNAKPNLNVTTQPTAVCDGASVNLASAKLTDNVGTLTYFSDKSCTVSSLSTVMVTAANSPKKYWVVVKNPSGCSDTAELTATVHPLPAKPTINGDTELCEGSSITLTTTQTAGISYVWKAGGTAIAGTTNSQIVSPTTKTSYTVVVKNANGCESTSAAHEVTVNKKPTVTITTPAAACAGSVINLTATVTGGSATYTTYTWTGATKGSPENTASATLAAGNNTYKLTVVDDKSCSGEGSITVTGNSIKATLTASPGTINAGNSSTLTAGFTPVTGGQYEFWEVTPTKNKIQAYSTTSTRSVAPTETTTYRVIAKNTIGCIDSADATVTVQERPLEVIDATTPAICAGETTVSKILEFKATVRNGAKPYQSVAWTGLPTWVQVDRTDSAVIKITGYSSSEIAGTYPVTLTVKDKNGVTKSTSANFVVNELPTILINGQTSGDLAVCKNGTLTLTATGGATYSWTNPTATTGATRVVTTTTADAAGTNYTVIGTDAKGCSATVTRKVIINELPTIGIDAVQTVATICFGGTATLAATGATTYSWSNGSGAAIIGQVVTTPALTAGTTYTVTGTDANGCTNTATQAVTVNLLPTVSFSTVNDDCAGSEINLEVTITGTAPYKNYKWSNNATAVLNDSIKAKSTLLAGANNYTFSVADANGCVGNASKSVNGKKYNVTITPNPSGIVTEGTSVRLTASVSPSGNFTYTFKRISPNPLTLTNSNQMCNVVVDETSTYRAYIKENTFGCVDSQQIVIQTTPTVLRIESSVGAEVCEATSGVITGKSLSVVAKGGTPSYKYEWSGIPAGITTGVTNGSTLDITGITSAVSSGVKNISVTVTDAAGGSVTGTVALTVNAIPDVKINGAKSGELKACVGGALTLTTTPSSGVTYQWLAPTAIVGASTAMQVINTTAAMASTAYTVQVTDAKGCIAQATRDVVVNVLPTVTLDADKEIVCTGTKVTLLPGGADSYTWSHGLTGELPEVTPTVTITYTVTGTTNGCSALASIEIKVNPLPTITVTQDPTGFLCVGSSVELTADGAATYAWKDGPSTDNYVVSPTATTTYEVTGTDANGCVNTKEYTVNVQGKPLLTLNTPAPGCSGVLVDLSTLVKSSETTSGLRYKYYTSADVELTGNDIKVSVGGTYKVEGTTTEGCSTGKIEVEVVINPQPEITLTADKLEYCSGDTVELTAAVSNPNVITYAWNRSELGTASTAKDCPIATTASRSIEYSVTATLTATGCNRTEKTSVTINPRPQLSGVFTPLTNPIPEGFSLTLTVSSTRGEANPTYTWVTPAASDEGSGNSATVLSVRPPSCDFKVFAVDAKGCKSDTLKKRVTVTPQGGILDATINAASTFVCNNGMTVLTAEPENGNADYYYSWVKSGSESDILGTDKILNVITAGTYKVTVTDESSPVQTKIVEITISSLGLPAPVANAGADQTIAQGSSTVLFGSATGGVIKSYVWSPQDKLTADKSTANPTTSILNGLQTYTLYVKDENGCISMPDEVDINVNTTNPKISVVASPATICIDNTSQFRVIAENGTLSAPTYEWTPSAGLVNSNSASPTFKGTADGTYSFVVKVTDGPNVYGAKVAVTVGKFKAPILAFDNAVNCAGDELTVTNTGTIVSSTAAYKWIIDGVVNASTGSKCALPVGTHNVTVIASASNGCASDSVKTTATIHALPVIQFAAGNQTTVVDGTSFNMVAEATGASIPVAKYNWTLPTVITGGSDTYVATASGTSMTFTLTGESAEGCESAPITTVVQVTPSGDRLKVIANIESEVVCVGGAAYLNATASKGKPGYTYKWFVEGTSVALSTDSTYIAKPTVSTNYVVEATDGELTLAYDTVRLTIGANLAPQADAGLDMSVLSGNTTVLFGSGTGGTGSSYIYVWSPLDKLSADATTANPRTVGLTSAQMYTLYVVDENGCKSKPNDVQVSVPIDGDFFAIEATASPQSICLGNTSTLGVKVTKGTATDVTYLWMPGAASVASPKFTPSSAGTFDYYVTVTDKKGQRTSDKVTITVTPDNAPKIAFDGTPRCVGDTIHVKHTGTPVPINYDRFVSFGGKLQETKNTLDNFYNFAQPGNYNVKFIAHAGVCNSDTISGNYTIGTMLNATVTPEYLVEAKNAVHNFEVTAPVGGYSYEWSGVVYNAAGTVDGSAANPVDASTKNNAKMKSTALKGDVRYIVKVTDDAGVACPASDTVWAYILPDAPSIDIDTAVNRVTAKIQWNTTDAWSDSLSIMGRKWDPYCMTSDDGGKYNQVHTTSQGIGNWSIPSMDTLEFYYATSYRIIPAVSATTKHYAKETSDTVGYYLQNFQINSSASGFYSNAWYPWYFDMSSKGVVKSSDVIIKTAGSIGTVRQRDHSAQSWGLATMEDMFDPGKYLDEFPLLQGAVMEFEVINPCKFMQYGKLPKPIEFIISGANSGYNNNLVFLQPLRLNLNESKDVILHIGTNLSGDDKVSTIRRWNFALQEIDLSTMRDMFDSTQFLDSFKIIPLMPLEVENPNAGNDVLWK